MNWLLMFWWGVGLSIATVLGAILVRKYRDTYGYAVLVAVLAAYVLAGNAVANRIAVVDLLPFIIGTVSTGSLMWAFTAQAMDMINEVYGFKKTLIAILLGYILNLFFVVFATLATTVEAAPWLTQYESGFDFIFGHQTRILFASWTAFVVTMIVDAVVYSRLKNFFYKREADAHTKPRTIFGLVTVRSVISDVVSMGLDSAIFPFLAFVGVTPWEALGPIIGTTIVIKVILSTLDTPWFIAYRLAIKGVKREY